MSLFTKKKVAAVITLLSAAVTYAVKEKYDIKITKKEPKKDEGEE